MDEYQKLAQHLDRLPDGFPPSEVGAEIRLLKRLFTSDEAKLAVYLTLDKEDAKSIASRVQLPIDEVKNRLDGMAQKGLIFSSISESGETFYQAAPFVVGIYEFQVNRLTDGFLKDLSDYWSTIKQRDEPKTINQLRTIPVNESIDSHLVVLPYEDVYALIDAQSKFAVAPCICRSRAKKRGKGCDAPVETCLVFGDFADFYVRIGNGRYVSKEEIKELLVKANEANLVLNPTNSKNISAICCCCGCCCGILRGIKYAPKPAEAVESSFIAEYNDSQCISCMKCLERCQMDALTSEGDQIKFNQDKCIGCGLCVSTCPSKALNLVRKLKREENIPETFFDTWRTIAKVRESSKN
ncbi:4Fe-4S dicluster domain-containing protein [Candidatus Bathyarchaeota archaeon]|nr:4Fe-4S dicluster domain-containing protein [Candidatus Bathyarchaeota archaeon]